MTVKEIAAAVGKTERAVHNWVTKASEKDAEISAKISEARATSRAADYDLDETCAIIEAGMGANAAGVYRASAQTAERPGADEELDRAFKAAVTGIYKMVATLDSRVTTIERAQETRKALLPPPGKTPRAELNEAVRALAARRHSDDFRRAWAEVYRELYYRERVNVTVRARNEGLKRIDILEKLGLLEVATSIAVELLS